MPNVFSQSCHHNLLLFITKSGCSGHLQLSYCTRKYFACQMLSKFHNTVRPLLCKTVAPCIRQTKPYVAQKIMSHTMPRAPGNRSKVLFIIFKQVVQVMNTTNTVQTAVIQETEAASVKKLKSYVLLLISKRRSSFLSLNI